jgi:uncharacterized CHY-type Zn-finger protein
MSNIQPVALINPPQAIFPRITVTSDVAALQLMLNDIFYDDFGAHEALFAVHDFCQYPFNSCNKSILVCGFRVQGVSVAQGDVPCPQHWHQVHASRGVPCAEQLSEESHAPSTCLSSNHKPHETKKTNW